jgi:hypothetical protein
MAKEWYLVPKIATSDIIDALEFGPDRMEGESWGDFYQRHWLAVLESAPEPPKDEPIDGRRPPHP